jgi:hypothetical protein
MTCSMTSSRLWQPPERQIVNGLALSLLQLPWL